MIRVLSVSSGRADVGILTPVWQALADRQGVSLHLFFTGMHRAEAAPPVVGIPDAAVVHDGGDDLGGQEPGQAAEAMALITRAAANLYAAVEPNVLLLIGDRLDMLPAAVASLPFNTPIMHLHGGEITEGAVDDRIRHAITKLAHLHCVSSQGSRRRLLAMGEEDQRITVTGAPGLDTLKNAEQISAGDLAAGLSMPTTEGLRLVTVHPETNAANPRAPLDAILPALEACPQPTFFTASNSDPGGREMKARIAAFVAAHDWAHYRDTLEPRLYANTLRHAALMLGNSSSGIIEAGLFGLPAVNVGNRQAGRERGDNVIDLPNEADAIIATLDRLGPEPARSDPGTPYGDGDAAPKVADALVRVQSFDGILRKRLNLPV